MTEIGERVEGVLYEFDAIDFDGCATGPWLGWWKARVGSGDGLWHGCFGDGMWSPQYVTAWRVADVERLRAELAATEGDLGVASREAAAAREALKAARGIVYAAARGYSPMTSTTKALALVDAALDQRLAQ